MTQALSFRLLVSFFAIVASFVTGDFGDVPGYKRINGNCQGNVLGEVRNTLSLQACASLCDQNADKCRGFSHDGKQICLLKTIDGCSEIQLGTIFAFYSKILAISALSTIPDTTTGQNDYPELKQFIQLNGDCVATGTAARNAYLLRTELDLGTCAQECVRRSLCAGFTFHQNNSECLLKVATCSAPQPNGLKVFYEKLQIIQTWPPLFPASSTSGAKVVTTKQAYLSSVTTKTTKAPPSSSSTQPAPLPLKSEATTELSIETTLLGRPSYLPIIIETQSPTQKVTPEATVGLNVVTQEPSRNVSTFSPALDSVRYPVIPKYEILNGSCLDGGTEICRQPLNVDPMTCAQTCLTAGSLCPSFTYDFINARCHLQNVTCTSETAVASKFGFRAYTKLDQQGSNSSDALATICSVPLTSSTPVPSQIKSRTNCATSLLSISWTKTVTIFLYLILVSAELK